MSSRNLAQMAYLYSMMGSKRYSYNNNNTTTQDIDVTRPTPPTPKGMKDWYIDGYHVQAVTKKSAIKKVNKLKSEQQ